MELYTFVLEFRGGTYINQIQASSIDNAIENWINTLNVNEIQYLSIKTKEQLLNNLLEIQHNSTPLNGLQAVWQFNFQTKAGFIIATIIRTNYK